jgi:protein TonB
MRKTLFILLFLHYNSLSAQQNERVTFIDDHGQSVKEKNASLLLQRLKINDTLWLFNFYDLFGPLVISMQTKDEEGNIRNGYFSKFIAGIVSSTEFYENGVLVPSSNAGFNIAKKRDTIGFRPVNLAKTDKDASFQWGTSAWSVFISLNLKYPARALKNKVQGTVIVRFTVDQDGKVLFPEITQSVEYSIDQEALRVIKTSPKWTPAFQNGKNVKSFKSQTINFRLPK